MLPTIVKWKGKMTQTCEKVLNLIIIKEIQVRIIYKIDKRQNLDKILAFKECGKESLSKIIAGN